MATPPAFTWTPGPSLRRAAMWVAVVSAVVAGSVVALSYVGDAPLATVWFAVWFLTFPFVLAVWGVMIFVLNAVKTTGITGRDGEAVGVGPLAWRVVVAAALVGVLALANRTSPGLPSGQPMEIDGRYVVNNHGTKTPITKEQYEELSSSWSRGFAAMELVFAGGAALVLSGPWGSRSG